MSLRALMKAEAQRQVDKEKSDQQEVLCLRASEGEGKKAILFIAEELHCEEARLLGQTVIHALRHKKPGFQMRLINRAYDMMESYRQVKKILKKMKRS